MSVDMFLKIKGVDGESVDSVHAKEIDIAAWSWGMSQSGTTHVGSWRWRWQGQRARHQLHQIH
jgi:type VI protein secretion system component Hcp